jgi:hypothetical protein
MANRVKINNGLILNQGLTVEDGITVITGSLILLSGATGSFTGSFTGNLEGTSSYASQALSASWAPSTSAFPFTGSANITGSLVLTGSLSMINSRPTTMFNAIGRSASLYLDLNGIGYNYLDNDRLFVRNSSGASVLMFVSSSGNVGIGTSTPNSRLEVNGNVNITGSATNSLLVRGSGTTSATYATAIQNSAGTNIVRFRNDGYTEWGTGGFSNLIGNAAGFYFDGGGTRAIQFTLNSANGPRITAGSIGLNVSIGQSTQVIQISGNANLGGNASTQVVDLGGTYTTNLSNITMDMMSLSPSFVLNSTSSFPSTNILRMGFTLNHTSGGQIIHGINHLPTLTAAYNFRAFSFSSANAYTPNAAVTDYIWSLITPNISASANNQLITGLDITLSGSNSSFTGVNRSALRLSTQNVNDRALTAIGNVVITGSLIVTGGITGSIAGSSGSSGAAFPYTGSADITGSLSVIGPTTLRGAGATSATNAMRVENSAGNPTLILRNDLTTIAQSIIIPTAITQLPAITASNGVFAMGNTSTEALGINAVALGAGSKARAPYSIAAGFENKTYGTSSVAMGNNNEASSSYSIALGDSNTAKGLSSFSAGNGNRSSGSYSTTIGSGNTADGFRAYAIGESNTMSGTRAYAFGLLNNNIGNQDVIVGNNNTSNGVGNVTAGAYLSGSGTNQVCLGLYNTTNSAATFIIGNGINSITRRNIVEVVGSAFNITGSFTVTTGSNVELQVLSTGVRLGSISTDTHTVTGSLSVSAGITGSLQGVLSSKYICQGRLSTNQSIPTDTDTVIQFVDDIDPNNWYDSGNYRFTPTIAGYYSISAGVWLSAPNVTTNQLNFQGRKNGNQFVIVQSPLPNDVGQSLTFTRMIYMNGSGDYLDFTVYQGAGGDVDINGGNGTWFSAHLIST